MCKELPYTEVIERVGAVNKTLLECGYNYKEIELFWKDCIKKVRTAHVMAKFFDGFTDGEIAKELGYSTAVVSEITAKYWREIDIGNDAEA